MRDLARHGGGDYRRSSLSRLARYLLRVEEIGRDAEAADLDDLARLLGRRPSVETADQGLIAFVEAAGPEHDEALVRLLDRRMQRAHLLMAPEGSLMLRHPRLHGLRPGSVDASSDDERWPAGAIPGTA